LKTIISFFVAPKLGLVLAFVFLFNSKNHLNKVVVDC